MTLGPYAFTLRMAIIGIAIALLVVAAIMVPSCVSKWRSERAQSRVDASQAQAASNSAADAINAVAASGGREAASEDMTRANAGEIRNAQGADVRAGAGVDLAGRRALCRRPAYKDDPKCAMFR